MEFLKGSQPPTSNMDSTAGSKSHQITATSLVVVDNEGCFIPGKGQPIPLDGIGGIHRFLACHPNLPLTFCTGRSVPYMEAMVQLAGLTRSNIPIVCEGGAVLYWPATDRHEVVCSEQINSSFLDDMPQGSFRMEPGKVVCLSLYPEPPYAVDSLASLVREIVDGSVTVQASAAAVDVTPLGVDKGTGLKALSQVTSIPLENMLCIGDSANDIPMLSIAGRSAAPANAADDVKRLVDYVSLRSYTDGVLEILERLIPSFNR
jgi:hydroxymethylpyrimidine pyrophosphatase-like HAD family hydrolase